MGEHSAPRARVRCRVAAVVLLAVAAFAGGAWWSRNTSADAATASGPAPTEPANDVANAQGGESAHSDNAALATPALAAAPPAAAWPPLPPIDTPLADAFDDLLDRASRGDNKAACRLGAELQRCFMAHANSTTAANIEQDVARRDNTPQAAVNAIVRLQSAADERGQGCDGIALAQMRTAFDWQRQAALADPALRVAFALSPALDPRDFIDDLDAWAAYRALALPWLEAAAAEGDVAAVIALARVHGDMRRTSPPFPRFRVQDDERFVIYADLMQRYGARVDVVEREAAAARLRLSPEAQQRATERADALYRADVHLDAVAAAEAMRSSLQATPDPARCE